MDQTGPFPNLLRGIAPYPALEHTACDPVIATEASDASLRRMVRVAIGTERIGYDELLTVIGRDPAQWRRALNLLVAVVAARNGRLDEALDAFPRMVATSQLVIEQYRVTWPRYVLAIEALVQRQREGRDVP